MSTSDQEQAVGTAPEERGASNAAEATVPGQASKRPSGGRGGAVAGDARDAGAGTDAPGGAGTGGPEGGPADAPDAAELPAAGGPEAPGRSGRATPGGAAEAREPHEGTGSGKAPDAAEADRPASAEADRATPAGPAPADRPASAEVEPASPSRSERAGTPDTSRPAAPARSPQLPQGTAELEDAGDQPEAEQSEPEPEARQGMAPWKARRVRMVAAGVLMAAMGVILVVRLATRSSVLVVGVYGLALILCGVVIELSRNGRTRLGSWLLVVGLAAAFGMDWFVLP
ncbi:DUF308 domain-containing protein [Streptomyces xanthochromogenes]|uniref:DUF308 domain-containing protein n=1 Tax=Streptomyces xanthochromogenes TaxID=67384 RepID=UPI00343CCE85